MTETEIPACKDCQRPMLDRVHRCSPPGPVVPHGEVVTLTNGSRLVTYYCKLDNSMWTHTGNDIGGVWRKLREVFS